MKQYLKENYKFILSIIFILVVFSIRFPYYIDAPGGITDVSEKIEINGYESEGSFNLAYVKEYRATIPTLIFSLFNKDWKVIKQDEVMLDTEDYKAYEIRDKILMDESISNAVYVAFKNSNRYIKELSNKLVIIYITDTSNTDLKVGDEIISINNEYVYSKENVANIVNDLPIGCKIDIKVKNNNTEYNRYAYIIEEDNNKIIGILISNLKEYQTNPKVNVIVDKNESGSSGGLITALSIYDSLVKEDITNGLKIVGTGTIDLDGNIGSIGGVEYKLKSAVKRSADLFIVPKDENYAEAIKLKKENNYDIEILGVSTFNEVIDYLNSKN
ncbi:MAG: hypothetical protein IJE04_00310 [Bacilli bacterium]|nr:hypothetical protein [Bacilli bacterium]